MLIVGEYYFHHSSNNRYPKGFELSELLFDKKPFGLPKPKYDVHDTSNMFWELFELKEIQLYKSSKDDDELIHTEELNNWYRDLDIEDKSFMQKFIFTKKFSLLKKSVSLSDYYELIDALIIDEKLSKTLNSSFLNTMEIEYPGNDFSIVNNFINLESLHLGDRMDTGLENGEMDISDTELEFIPDFSKLSKLKKFQFSMLNDDISPLAKLTSLEELTIYCDNVINIDPIKSLINLKKMIIFSRLIESIEPLRNLNKLEYLVIVSPNLHDIDALTDLRNLKRIMFLCPYNFDKEWIRNNSSIKSSKDIVIKEIPSYFDF